jgi:sulfur carrier protein ThiS
MKITLKLLVTYEKLLPPAASGGNFEIEVPEGSKASDILRQYQVPVDLTSVILVNGRTPPVDDLLQEGDVLCAFPIATGG